MPDYIIDRNGRALDDIYADDINKIRLEIIRTYKPNRRDVYEINLDLYSTVADPDEGYPIPFLGTLWKQGDDYLWKPAGKNTRTSRVSPTTGRLLAPKAKTTRRR